MSAALLAKHILLASHGTQGARAAEEIAMSVCCKGGTIHHLIVVPSFWQGMTGDDWLNNGSTRDVFRRYLEDELGREVDEHCERIHENARQHELSYVKEIILGEPEKTLINSSQKASFDLVVLGSPRPKDKKGLRSRMLTKNVMHTITAPLLIVPYPNG